MKPTKLFISVLTFASIFMLSGCGVTLHEYVKEGVTDEEKGKVSYQCAKEAQQSYAKSSTAIGQTFAGQESNSGATTNPILFDFCMKSHGYKILEEVPAPFDSNRR